VGATSNLAGLIHILRGHRVMLSGDLIYGVKTEEAKILRSQTVTSSWGGTRAEPFAFTEQGVAMLSQSRHILRKLSELESRVSRHATEIGSLIDAFRGSLTEDERPKRRIGFSSPG
jgi:hypothetical protein